MKPVLHNGSRAAKRKREKESCRERGRAVVTLAKERERQAAQQRRGKSSCELATSTKERESSRRHNKERGRVAATSLTSGEQRERALSWIEWRKKKMMKINGGRCSVRMKGKKKG